MERKSGLDKTEEGTLGIGGKELSYERSEESEMSMSVQTRRLKKRGILETSVSNLLPSQSFRAELGDGLVISSAFVADVLLAAAIIGALVVVPLVANFVDFT